MDVKIETDEINYKFRVSGLIIHNDSVLFVRMCNNTFYCPPGGHVELGESTVDALTREIEEETGYNIRNQKLICVTENFFFTKKKKVHELGFYYTAELKDDNDFKGDYVTIEHDKGGNIQHEFKWINISNLNEFAIKPDFLKNKLQVKNFNLEHYIIKD